MRITAQHTQMLMSALGAVVKMRSSAAEEERGRNQLVALHMQLSHEREMFGMKAALMRDLVTALIERRTDAVRQGFRETLSMYAEQCRHYMAQQDRYADAEIKATAPLERANLRARLSDIDLHLSSIRSDAAALYREMTRVVLLIGGTMPNMSDEEQRLLASIKQ